MAEPVRVDAEDLEGWAADILEGAGVAPPDARLVAASLVDADLRGIASHGVSRLGIYVKRLQAGGNRAAAEPEIVFEAPAAALVDARDGLSQVASARAVDLAVEKARVAGCAAVSVRGGSHFGAAGYWARLIAERGLVGLATTNTTPLMVPWGGAETVIGTNPLAFAFPSSRFAPVVVDVATSESTWGALMNAMTAGEPIPDTWALGEDGAPTTDAAEAVRAKRLKPFGRHKGYAIAVAVEILAGALAGAACLGRITDMYGQPDRPMSVGHLFVALDPKLIRGDDDFAATVADLQEELVAVAPDSATDRVLWPGQREAEVSAERRRTGVPVDPSILAAVRETAELLGLTATAEAIPV